MYKKIIPIVSLLALTSATSFAADNPGTLGNPAVINGLDRESLSELLNTGGMFQNDMAVGGVSTTFAKLPSSQIPLSFLKIKDKFGTPENDNRAIAFGGMLEAVGQTWSGNEFNKKTGPVNPTPGGAGYSTADFKSGQGIYLTGIELDILANMNSWSQIGMSIVGDGSDSFNPGYAFATFGQYDSSEENPDTYFVTIGKFRMPFGLFAGGGLIVDGLTQSLFRPTQLESINFGFDKEWGDYGHFNTNLTLFSPDQDSLIGDEFNGTYVKPTESTSNRHLSFMYSIWATTALSETISWSYNAGYMSNIANTSTLAGKYIGEDGSLYSMQSKNGAFNLDSHITFDNGQYILLGGWGTTTLKKDYTNKSRAGAWYLQTQYAPEQTWFGMEGLSLFSLGYNQSYNTNNLPMNMAGQANQTIYAAGIDKQFNVFAQREFTPSLLVGIEYAYQHSYNSLYSNAISIDASVYF